MRDNYIYWISLDALYKRQVGEWSVIVQTPLSHKPIMLDTYLEQIKFSVCNWSCCSLSVC
jgi:hypothetical protein